VWVIFFVSFFSVNHEGCVTVDVSGRRVAIVKCGRCVREYLRFTGFGLVVDTVTLVRKW